MTPILDPFPGRVSFRISRSEETHTALTSQPSQPDFQVIHLDSSHVTIMFFHSSFPFLLHALIEAPAGFNFLIRPSEQLSSPAPQAHGIIRQYGVLLLVSVAIALIFAFRPVDKTSRNMAGALSLYHPAPLTRAVMRIRGGESTYGKGLGGPWVHAVVHFGCCVALGQLFLRGRRRARSRTNRGKNESIKHSSS